MADSLAKRMKALEIAADPDALAPGLPIYARIDGRAFSSLTRSMRRPYDLRMIEAMQTTAESLLEQTGARAAYVQSDEISLVWMRRHEQEEPFFGGRPMKMASILAGMATAAFTGALRASDDPGFAEYAARLPHFDARVMGLADCATAADMLDWRGRDARRNAVQMLARHRYSPRALYGVDHYRQIEMIEAAGDRLGRHPDAFLNGTLMRRLKRGVVLDDAQRLRIPEAHRPAPLERVERTITERLTELPGRLCNLEATLFEEGEPDLAHA